MISSLQITPKEKINDLALGVPNLSEPLLKSFAEACSYCLDLVGHNSGVFLRISGDVSNQIFLEWNSVDDTIKRSYNDSQEALEWGATAISFLIIKNFTNYTVIERSCKGTGFDFWLGDYNDPLFQRKAKLEASGIMEESKNNKVTTRVKTKINQINSSNNTINGYVVVVEFSNPKSQVSIQ